MIKVLRADHYESYKYYLDQNTDEDAVGYVLDDVSIAMRNLGSAVSIAE